MHLYNKPIGQQSCSQQTAHCDVVCLFTYKSALCIISAGSFSENKYVPVRIHIAVLQTKADISKHSMTFDLEFKTMFHMKSRF